jgi:hypothetical protein
MQETIESEWSDTQLGRFRKNKNQTLYRWNYKESEYFPTLACDMSLEGLKHSTIDLKLRIDTSYTQ